MNKTLKCEISKQIILNEEAAQRIGSLCLEEAIKILHNIPDPYPLNMCHIKNDKEYAALISDTKIRTAVSWYLMGEAHRAAKKEFELRLITLFGEDENEKNT